MSESHKKLNGVPVVVPENGINGTDVQESLSTETLSLEYTPEKVCVSKNFAPRKKFNGSSKESDENNDGNKNDDERKSTDEGDGPMREKIEYEEMEEVVISDGDAIGVRLLKTFKFR
ncbi:hypothetical protein JTB14_035444 [Gonioctena quinquepunctata]|nr:hypothetical protein JTB14_035444 [Gonioctena quinquepunctata]